MVKFEVQQTEGLDGKIHYRFDVGIVNEFQVACQLTPPNGVVTKDDLARILYQLTDHLSDGYYSKRSLEWGKITLDLFEENRNLKNLLATKSDSDE